MLKSWSSIYTILLSFAMLMGLDMSAQTKEPTNTSGFEAALRTIDDEITGKNYEKAYAEAVSLSNKLLPADTSGQILVYRLLAEINHYLGNDDECLAAFEQQQTLSRAYGWHVDYGIRSFNPLTRDSLSVIFDEVLVWHDPSAQLKLEDVTQVKAKTKFRSNKSLHPGQELFKAYKGDNLATDKLVEREGAYWMKVDVIGSYKKSGRYLFGTGQIDQSWDTVDIFYNRNGRWQNIALGMARTPDKKSVASQADIFWLELDTNERVTLYIRATGNELTTKALTQANFISLYMLEPESALELFDWYHVPTDLNLLDHSAHGEGPAHVHINYSPQYIVDNQGQYSLQDVRQNWDKLKPRFQYQMEAVSDYYWVRIKIAQSNAQSGAESFFISSYWNKAEIYIIRSSGKIDSLLTGTGVPLSTNPYKGILNLLNVDLTKSDSVIVYLRLHPKKRYFQIWNNIKPFEIQQVDSNKLITHAIETSRINYFQAGAFTLYALLFLVLFVVNKEKIYAYLCLGLFGLLTIPYSLLILQLTSFTPWHFTVLLGTACIYFALLGYSRTYLDIKRLSRPLDKVIRISMLVYAVAYILISGYVAIDEMSSIGFGDYSIIWQTSLLLLDIPVVILSLFLGVYAWIKGQKQAKSLLLFQGFMLLALLSETVADIDIYKLFTFFLISALVSLALITANRLKNLREDQQKKEKAEASEKAKHQFLANMSHEIRTPMNAIKGMTEILLRRKVLPEQQEYLSAIKESSDSLLFIINDILDLSKIEAGKIELEHIPFSLRDVVQNAYTVAIFKAEEKGLTLKLEIDENLPAVMGDPTRLNQILLNLISNAVKFTEKGKVTIGLKLLPSIDGNQVKIQFSVKDSGIGIDASQIEKIFRPFEQAYSDTSRKFGGTGLGLSITQKLVETHGGKIWVESEKGVGSIFFVEITYQRAEEDEAISNQANHEIGHIAQNLKGIRVLLAEDNAFNTMVATEELEDAIEDVVVVAAKNGQEALELLAQASYDVILMDVQMPVINGLEATQAIRKMTDEKARVPIIAMTANVLKEEVELCFKAGMDDFIGKPFDTQELLEKIYNLTQNHKRIP